MKKLIISWIVCGIINAAALNAYFRSEFPNLSHQERWPRENFGHCLAMGLIFGPVGLVVGFFMTGFYQDGFSLSYKQEKYI